MRSNESFENALHFLKSCLYRWQFLKLCSSCFALLRIKVEVSTPLISLHFGAINFMTLPIPHPTSSTTLDGSTNFESRDASRSPSFQKSCSLTPRKMASIVRARVKPAISQENLAEENN